MRTLGILAMVLATYIADATELPEVVNSEVPTIKVPENSYLVQPTSMTDQLLYSTVRLEAIDATRGITSTGTGFLVQLKLSNNNMGLVVITNKHVVEGATACRLKMHTKNAEKNGPSGEIIPVHMEPFAHVWIGHPDPNVDICAIPMGGLFKNLQEKGIEIFVKALPTDLFVTDEQLAELRAVENILMVGYPIGLSDDVHNYPIFRRGITATHPAVDYQGRPEFMIDAACFPGSSGSPVLIVDEGSYATVKGGLHVGGRAMLLGALWGGPVESVEGAISVSPIPTSVGTKVSTRIMINLGYVIKAREIQKLLEYAAKQDASNSPN